MSPECFVFIVVVGAASGLIYAVSKFKWRKASEGNVVAMVIDRTMNPTYPLFLTWLLLLTAVATSTPHVVGGR